MKKGLLILLFALLAGLASYCLTRSRHHAAGGALLDEVPELAWLRGELSLSDEQFAKAQALHAAYRPHCEEMCANIAEARTRMEALAAKSNTVTPELAQAVQDYARVRAECQQHMLAHLYQTAALMDGKQARRYLDTVLPHVLDPNSQAAVGHSH